MGGLGGWEVRQCFRWFGPDDPVGLADIRQAGATDIVTSLHHLACGEAWPDDEIARRVREVSGEGRRPSGLEWTIAESLPVHESIKLRTNGCLQKIEYYQESLSALAGRGIKVAVFNFMPATDWTRTDLENELPDGSRSTAYDGVMVAAYDIFLLERPGARSDYPEATVEAAKRLYSGMDHRARDALASAILLGLPGGGGSLCHEALRERIAAYRGVTKARLRENLYAFMNALAPVCEASGIRLAVHPDDPPLSVFGLPRAMSTAEDVEAMAAAVPSPSAGLVLCAGSLGSRPDNDPVALFQRFADRVHFVHMRNIHYLAGRDDAFMESGSLAGSIDMPRLMEAIVREEERRRELGRDDYLIPVRPDLGKLFSRDAGWNYYPGYSFIGRTAALAELRGLEAGIRHALGLSPAHE
jgi:mannonate dehydratase